MSEPDLLTATELMARVGLKRSQFHLYRRRGLYRHLEVARPVGQRKYSRVLVEKFLAGEPVTRLMQRRTA